MRKGKIILQDGKLYVSVYKTIKGLDNLINLVQMLKEYISGNELSDFHENNYLLKK